MKKILFIINPRSGVDRNKKLESAIALHLDNRQFDPYIRYTEYAAHATALAKEAVDNGFAIVAAVGGDGTVNEVIAGIYGSQVVLAILPKGSGNGLARSLGIPLQLRKSLVLINKGCLRTIDLGQVNGRYFASNTGLGFDVDVIREFAGSQRRGLITYTRLILKHLWHYSCRNWMIQVDGRQIGAKAFMVTIANARQLGYQFHIAPVADLEDGILDLVIIKEFPRWKAVAIAFRAFTGSLLNSRYIIHATGREIKIQHQELHQFQADGDLHTCNTILKATVIPKAIRVIVPQS